MEKETKKDEQVMIPKSKLDDLLKLGNEVQELKQKVAEANSSSPVLIEKVKDHNIRLRSISGKIVTAFIERNWIEKDNFNNDVEMTKIELTDPETLKTEEKKVEYWSFLDRADTIELKVKDRKVKNIVKEEGIVEVKAVEGYRTVGLGTHVRVENITPETSFVVTLSSGKDITVSEKVVNI